jgi:hypothetical protein
MMTETIKKVSKKRGAEKKFTPFLKEQITGYLPMHLSQFRIVLTKTDFFEEVRYDLVSTYQSIFIFFFFEKLFANKRTEQLFLSDKTDFLCNSYIPRR